MMVKTWLVQRLKRGKDFMNPYNNVNTQLHYMINKIISPEYMGAAEYEWGAYPECINKMIQTDVQFSIYHIHGCNIYIVSSSFLKDLETSRTYEEINKLFFEPAEYFIKHGKYLEISKSDYSSFYKTVYDILSHGYDNKSNSTIGWLNLKKHYAFFTCRETAESFYKTIKTINKPEERKEEITND